MKHTLFLLSVCFLFLFTGCNKNKIILKIVSPVDNTTFKTYEDIKVSVTADTKKGSILQVILTVDTLKTVSLTTEKEQESYDFLIPKYTFENEGLYFLSVMAYSTEGVQEGAAIYIKIEK